MRSISVILLLLFFHSFPFIVAADSSTTDALHAGFNPRINWMSFADATETARDTQKPILLAIWLPGDKLTNQFRSFFDDERVERLSTSFHMVQAPWGTDSQAAKEFDLYPFVYAHQLDGAYMPRVVFIHKGKVQLITNRDLLSHRWYYTHPDSLVRSMEEAIQVLIYQAELKPPPGWKTAEETQQQGGEEAAEQQEQPSPSPSPPPAQQQNKNPLPGRPKNLIDTKIELDKMAEAMFAKQEMERQEKEAKAAKERKDERKDEL